MFRAVTLVQDPILSATIEHLALESRLVHVQKSFDRVPRPYELAQTLNLTKPDLLFVETDESRTAQVVAQEVKACCSVAAVVEVSTEVDTRRRARDFYAAEAVLIPPITVESFSVAVENAVRPAREAAQQNVCAVIPAKAGSGASTVALNTAAAIAQKFSKRVLLIEGDLHSGVLADMLGIEAQPMITELLEQTAWLDDADYKRAVASLGGVDFLLTDRVRKVPAPTWSDWYRILAISQAHYDVVIVDLPELINDATAEIVRRAAWVWIVATPELQSLTLTRQRNKELIRYEIPQDRIEMVLNRWHKDDPSPAEIEDLLGQRIAASLCNDYMALHRVMLGGRFLVDDSKLARGFAGLAKRLCAPDSDACQPERGSFLNRLLTGNL